jgi:hypothetical protein
MLAAKIPGYSSYMVERKQYLLCVPAICNRFALIILQYYVSKLWIRHILDNVPFYWEESVPLVLLPEVHILVEIKWADHLSHATELTTSINLITIV